MIFEYVAEMNQREIYMRLNTFKLFTFLKVLFKTYTKNDSNCILCSNASYSLYNLYILSYFCKLSNVIVFNLCKHFFEGIHEFNFVCGAHGVGGGGENILWDKEESVVFLTIFLFGFCIITEATNYNTYR